MTEIMKPDGFEKLIEKYANFLMTGCSISGKNANRKILTAKNKLSEEYKKLYNGLREARGIPLSERLPEVGQIINVYNPKFNNWILGRLIENRSTLQVLDWNWLKLDEKENDYEPIREFSHWRRIDLPPLDLDE